MASFLKATIVTVVTLMLLEVAWSQTTVSQKSKLRDAQQTQAPRDSGVGSQTTASPDSVRSETGNKNLTRRASETTTSSGGVQIAGESIKSGTTASPGQPGSGKDDSAILNNQKVSEIVTDSTEKFQPVDAREVKPTASAQSNEGNLVQSTMAAPSDKAVKRRITNTEEPTTKATPSGFTGMVPYLKTLVHWPEMELKQVFSMFSAENHTMVCARVLNRTATCLPLMGAKRLFMAGLKCYGTMNAVPKTGSMNETYDREAIFRKTHDQLKAKFASMNKMDTDMFCMKLFDPMWKPRANDSMVEKLKRAGMNCPCQPPPLDWAAKMKDSNMTKERFFYMAKEEMRKMFVNMSSLEMGRLCSWMMNRTSSEAPPSHVLGAMFEAGLNCSAGSDLKFEGEAAARMYIERELVGRHGDDRTKWSADAWKEGLSTAPDGITGAEMDKMDVDVFKTLVDKDLSARNLTQRGAREAFVRLARQAYGQPDKWTKDQINKMAPSIGAFNPYDIMQIPKEEMKRSRASFRGIRFENRATRFSVAKKICNKDDIAAMTTTDLEICGSHIANNPAALKKVSEDKLMNMLKNMSSSIEDSRDTYAVSRKLRTLEGFRDPSKMNHSMIEKMGPYLAGCGRDFIDKLDPTALATAFGQNKAMLTNLKIRKSEFKSLAKKLVASGKLKPARFSKDDMKNLGGMMVGLEPADWDKIPDAALNDTEVMMDISRQNLGGPVTRKLLKRVMNLGAGGRQMMKKMGAAMRYAKPSELQDVCSNLDLPCDSTDDGITMKLGRAQARLMYKCLKKRYIAQGTSLTSVCAKTWKKIDVIKGMDDSDCAELPNSSELLGIAEQVTGSIESDMDASTLKCIGQKVCTYLTSSDAAIQAIKAADVDGAGHLLKYCSQPILDKISSLNKEVVPTIVKKIGESDLGKFSRTQQQRLTAFALKHVERDVSGTMNVIDRSAATELDKTDMLKLGGLVCGMTKEMVMKMTNETVMEKMEELGFCQTLDEDTERAVVQTATEKVSNFVSNSENLISASNLMEHLTKQQRDQINKEDYVAALPDISNAREMRKKMREERDLQGFKDEWDAGRRSRAKQNAEVVGKLTVEAITDPSNAINSRRKKRAATGLTCSDLKTMGTSLVVTLNITQLEGLTTLEFSDCAEFLGAISGWNATQLTTLAAEAKAAFNTDVSMWTAEQVRMVGSIVGGLMASDIEKLNLNNDETITSVGKHNVYSSSQRQSAFKRWLSQALSSSPAAITADQLISLGHFACGATNDHINQFSHLAYKDAASQIGALSSCEEVQLNAYAGLAKRVYGSDPVQWNTTVVTTIGNVIGGLSAVDISTLSTGQIAVLPPTAIEIMPPSRFDGFTKSQLSAFSQTQASAVTAAQQALLTSEEMSALSAAGATQKGTIKDKGGDNSAATATCTAGMLLAPVFAYWLSKL